MAQVVKGFFLEFESFPPFFIFLKLFFPKCQFSKPVLNIFPA